MLPTGPTRLLAFDGVDDYISVNNSQNVSNPYDLERTNSFSLAAKITPGKTTFIGSSMDIINKVSGTSGYFLGLASGLAPLFGFTEGGVTKYMGASSGFGITQDVEGYIVATYDGSSNLNTGIVIHIYNSSGTISQRCTQAGGTLSNVGGTTLSGTIKNTTAIWFGRNTAITTRYFLGKQSHYSIWNVAFTNTQADELVTKMMQDKVSTHTIYSASCLGYWREFVGTLAINSINSTYNGTLNNFSANS
jgi:hypothetical protein